MEAKFAFIKNGLTANEVKHAREKYGQNKLPTERPLSWWWILLRQLKSPLVYIILVAAIVSLAMGQISDFILIILVVVVDVAMGFAQEYKAQQTYTALKNLLKPKATVIRGGQRQQIEVAEIVVGDVVILATGEKSPADGVVVQSTKLSIDEAILTGESEPIGKHASEQVFAGTTVLTGRGVLQITAVGVNSKIGIIAQSLSGQKEEETPLQVRLKSLSRSLTIVVVAFTIAILIVGLLLGYAFFDILRIAIALAMAAIPEAILIAVTLILALGMRRILKRNGLVKKLLAVETLGSVSVICTDKTGTITEGRMRVVKTDFVDAVLAWQTMIFCNDLEGPVDIALWDYAQKQSLIKDVDPQQLLDSTKRLDEEPFTSEAKFMLVEVQNHELYKENVCFLKGAPEVIMGMCQISEGAKKQILSNVDKWADDGLRVLALAFRRGGGIRERANYEWIGLIGLQDPVRVSVVESIKAAHQAGIDVKMITGDYSVTAATISKKIGLQKDGKAAILEGNEIVNMPDNNLAQRVKDTAIFSRIFPQDKLRVVDALQQNGHVVAMIGDGVNDAPALKRSNIGVVVNSATDLAKENADLILLDGNFSTIVWAIEEGRIIFANLQKVVAYMLSNSFAELITIFVALIFGWPAPLAVAQILWINLICDGPSNVILGFEPAEKGVMQEKPRSLKSPILTPLSLVLIAVISIFSAVVGLLMFGYFYNQGDIARGQSMVFASFCINSLVYLFGYRSMRRPLLASGSPFKNPYLIWTVLVGVITVAVAFAVPIIRHALGLVLLTWQEWLIILVVAVLFLVVVEIGKASASRLRLNS